MTGLTIGGPAARLPEQVRRPDETMPDMAAVPFCAVLSAAARDDRPFADGTMHGAVEAFGARGLVGSGAAAAVGEQVAEPAPRSPEPIQNMRLVAGPQPPPQAGVRAADPPSAVPIPSPTQVGPTPSESVAAPARPAAARVGGRSSAALLRGPDAGPAARAPVATPDDGVSVAPERPAARRSAPPAATAPRVTVTTGAGGADVSVTGGRIEADTGDALHDAVARLLSRHGLVLGQLRISGSAARDGRQGERR